VTAKEREMKENECEGRLCCCFLLLPSFQTDLTASAALTRLRIERDWRKDCAPMTSNIFPLQFSKNFLTHKKIISNLYQIFCDVTCVQTPTHIELKVTAKLVEQVLL
jgi:hypothetical protein